MSLPNALTRMTLSDLLDRTARLTGKVFVRGLAVGVVVMLPAGVLLGFAMREVFAAMADTMHLIGDATSPSVDAFRPMFYGATEIGIAALLFMFGRKILEGAVIDTADAEIHAAPRTWQGAFTRGWDAALRMFAQYLIVALACAGLCLTAVVVGALMRSAAAAVLLMTAAAVMIVWLLISWTFGAQAIMCEHTGPTEGLARSHRLVRGHWWRVFGILALFLILSTFAAMIITFPLQGIVFASIANDMLNLERQFIGDPQSMTAMEPLMMKLSSIGWQLGVLQAVSTVLTCIVQSVYATLLYYDLRARRGEFDAPQREEHP